MTIRSEGSLLDWLRQRPPGMLSLQDVAHLIRQAADALQNAHNSQVIYRKVAPSNFLIRSNGEHPNLPDLQLIDIRSATSPDGLPNVASAMAPEQWRGVSVPATDQYALAILAYQLLTWQSPFQGNQEQVMQQHLNVQPQPPGRINPRIPPAVDAVILRALAKKPENRFPGISAFADAFQQAIQAPDSPPIPQISRTSDTASIHEATTPAQPSQPSASNPVGARINRVSRSSQIRELLLLGLVFIIVVSSIGFGFYFIVGSNQAALAHLQKTGITNKSSATLTPTAALGTPILDDSLSRNTNGRWPENATCIFKGGTYHVLVQQANSVSACFSNTLTFDNVAIQVDVALLSGFSVGFAFRFKGNQFYTFEITNQRNFYLGGSGTSGNKLLVHGENVTAIIPGNAKNTLLLIAKGSDFKLYINNVFVGEAQDNGSTSGQFGFLAGTLSSMTEGEGSFSHLKVFPA